MPETAPLSRGCWLKIRIAVSAITVRRGTLAAQQAGLTELVDYTTGFMLAAPA